MASPTAASLESQWKAAVAALDHLLVAQTVPADVDTYEQLIQSDFAAEQLAGMAEFRRRVAAGVGSAATVLAPILTAYAHHVVGSPERSTQAVIDRIYAYFVANNKHLKSRDFTFGTPGAFTGTGTGLISRLTVDENAYDLENGFADTKTIRCIQDEQSGANKHEEVFELRGENRGRDVLAANGSGRIIRNYRASSSNDSELKNPTFSQYAWTTAPAVGVPSTGAASDTLTGWTLSDATDFQLDIDQFSHDVVGDTTPTSVRMLDNATMTQLFSEAPIRINPDAPYFVELWVRRESNADGTLTVRLGATSQAFTVSSLSNGAWNRVVLDLDEGLWPINFNEASADFQVQWSGRSTGTLAFDEFRLFQMTPFDGSWYALTGGLTEFLLDDTEDWTDTISSDSKMQKWMWRAFARYLPHVSNATQVTASGGRTLTWATAGDTITASSGSFVSDGYVVGMILTVAGTSSNNGTFTITNVSATVLTVAENLTDEGPLSATATLNATASITDPA